MMREEGPKPIKLGVQAPLIDEEAEQAAISLAFQDFSYFKRLVGLGVKQSWFADHLTAVSWGLIEDLYQPPATEITVFGLERFATQELSTDMAPKAIKTVLEAGRLAIPDSQLEKYQLRLLEAFQRRLLQREGFLLQQRALDPNKAAKAIVDAAQTGINKIKNAATPTEITDAPKLASEAHAFYSARLQDKGQNAVMPYPWKSMNKATDGGMRKPEVTILKGPTGIGKTQIGQLIWKRLSDAGFVTLAVSLEMPRRRLLARCVQQETGVSSSKMEVGDFATWQNKVFGEISRFGQTKAYVIDDPRTTIASIERALEYIQQTEGKVDFLLLDYAQLLKEPAENDILRHQKISEGILELTKIFNLHTLMIVRQNREGTINGSSQYEYDAENIWAYTNELATSQAPIQDKAGLASITIEKARYGKTGEIPLWYNPFHIRLTDPDDKLPFPDPSMWK